jgi:uncharacterized protein YbcI
MNEVHGLSTAGEISRRSVQMLREYTGRGPTKARTILNHDSVLILLGDTLTKGERKLAENGKGDHVRNTRQEFQRVMGDDLIRMVEEETGRKVIAFMSDNHIDPDYGAEVFVLDPSGDANPRDGYEG